MAQSDLENRFKIDPKDWESYFCQGIGPLGWTLGNTMWVLFIVAVLMNVDYVFGSSNVSNNHPRIKAIYTMDGCPPCVAVERKLEADGHKMCITLKVSSKAPVDAFPTVLYSDGYRDNGERVKAGYYTAKPLIGAVKWSPSRKD